MKEIDRKRTRIVTLWGHADYRTRSVSWEYLFGAVLSMSIEQRAGIFVRGSCVRPRIDHI